MRCVVLCSAIGLGHYVPGIVLAQALRALGHETSVEVFEYLTSERAQRLGEQRNVLADPRAYRIFTNIVLLNSGLPEEVLLKTVARWLQLKLELIVIMSGAWIPFVNAFQIAMDMHFKVVALHIDSVKSPSWHAYDIKVIPEQYLFTLSNRRGLTHIRINVHTERRPLAIIHGGGWNLCQQGEAIDALLRCGIGVLSSSSSRDDAGFIKKPLYFRHDPAWVPTPFNSSVPLFLPTIQVEVENQFIETYMPFRRLLRRCTLIISKAGGATLLDSYELGIPVVFLKAFGPHEYKNEQLWCFLGFGLTWEDWTRNGYSQAPIKAAAIALRKARAESSTFLADLVREEII